MTVREFMNYLQYIEHAPENLQFFLWFRDYSRRYEQSRSRNPFLTPLPTAKSDRPNIASSEYHDSPSIQSLDGAADPRPAGYNAIPKATVAPWEAEFDKESNSLMKVHSSAQDSYRAIAERTFTHAGISTPGKLPKYLHMLHTLIDTKLPIYHTVMRSIA